jgi:hypothetical protein
MKRFLHSMVLALAALVTFLLYPFLVLKAAVRHSGPLLRALLVLALTPLARLYYNPRFGAVKYVNTITNLIPTIYEALDVVSRELVGMIPAVALSASAERAALNQTITAHIAPASTATDITPGVTPPNDGDQTIGNVQLSITKARRVPVRWAGEESLSLNAPGGLGRATVMKDQFIQAIRTLVNEMETDLSANSFLLASRAAGTQGTPPFSFSATASGFEALANTRQILVDNGAPPQELQMVLNTTHGAKLRAVGQLNNVAFTPGAERFVTQGVLMPLQGMDLRESGKIGGTFTKGAGTAYTSTAAGFAVGTTVIPLITGSGTVLAGDIVTFAGDTNQYVVTVGIAAPGSITIQEPGLRQAIPAVATALTIVGNTVRNIAFHRNAIVLATRLPARPQEGDQAVDVTTITDPRSGITLEVALYKQYRQVQYEISVAWGVKMVAPRHTALLIG